MGSQEIKLPTDVAFFHVTHWKAGSQWLRGIFQEAFGAAVVDQEPFAKHVFGRPTEVGKLYSCSYLTKQEFEKLQFPALHRRLLVIRDLRDTLVSAYFSYKNTHSAMGRIEKLRWFLNASSQEEGLLYLMDIWLPQVAAIQRTWLESGEPFLRLEDFMNSPAHSLRRAFTEFWKLDISEEQVKNLAEFHSFSRYSGGRLPGQEDLGSHYRKGVPEDWRQHFTPKAQDLFYSRYLNVVRMGGYEAESLSGKLRRHLRWAHLPIASAMKRTIATVQSGTCTARGLRSS